MPEPRSRWRTVRLWLRRARAAWRAGRHCEGCAYRTHEIPLSYFDDPPTCHWCGAAVAVGFTAGHYVTEHRCEVHYRCSGCGEWVDPAELEYGDGHVVEERGGHGNDSREMCGPVKAVSAEERVAAELMGDEPRGVAGS